VLAGQSAPSAETIALAAARAADGVEPLNDIHASTEYRAHLARVNTGRALEKALARG
jgi:carbon-monoxide dehydrogenase medium subunit